MRMSSTQYLASVGGINAVTDTAHGVTGGQSERVENDSAGRPGKAREEDVQVQAGKNEIEARHGIMARTHTCCTFCLKCVTIALVL